MQRRIAPALLLALLAACEQPFTIRPTDVTVEVRTARVAGGEHAAASIRNDTGHEVVVLSCLDEIEGRTGAEWTTLNARACAAVVGAGEVALDPGETFVDSLPVPAGTRHTQGRFVFAIASIEGGNQPYYVMSPAFGID